MNILRLLPVILSFLLIAAHFYRASQNILAVTALLLPFLLFIRHPRIALAIQMLLILSAMEWLRSLAMLISLRIDNALDWYRLAIIIGAVILFTLSSCLVFQAKEIRRYFNH